MPTVVDLDAAWGLKPPATPKPKPAPKAKASALSSTSQVVDLDAAWGIKPTKAAAAAPDDPYSSLTGSGELKPFGDRVWNALARLVPFEKLSDIPEGLFKAGKTLGTLGTPGLAGFAGADPDVADTMQAMQMMFEGAQGASQRQFEKAMEGGEEKLAKADSVGDSMERTARLFAGALPLIGPAAADTGERLGQGDVAGAGIDLAGMIGPDMVAGAMGKARAGATAARTGARTGAEATDAAHVLQQALDLARQEGPKAQAPAIPPPNPVNAGRRAGDSLLARSVDNPGQAPLGGAYAFDDVAGKLSPAEIEEALAPLRAMMESTAAGGRVDPTALQMPEGASIKSGGNASPVTIPKQLGGPEAPGLSAADVIGSAEGAGGKPFDPKTRVPLTIAERTGSEPLRKMEAMVEASYGGAGTFKKFRKGQVEAVKRYADEVTQYILDGAEQVDPASRGQKVLDEVENAVDALNSKAKEQYALMDQLAGNRIETAPKRGAKGQMQGKERVARSNIGVRYDELAKVAKDELAIMKAQKVPGSETARAKALFESFARAGKKPIPFSVAHADRSDLIALTRAYDGASQVPGKAGGGARRMAQLLDTAMEEAAIKSKNPAVVEAWRKGSDIWKDVKSLDSELLRKIALKDPSQVPAMLPSMSMEKQTALRESLTPATRQQIKAGLVADIFEKADKGGKLEAPKSLMQRLGLSSPSTSTPLSTASLNADIEKLRKQAGPWFKPTELEALASVAKIAERTGKRPGQMVSTFGNAYLFYAFNKAAFGGDITPLVGGYAMTRLFARVMTRADGALAYKNYLEAVGDKAPGILRNSAAADRWGRRLAAIAKEEAKEEARRPSGKASDDAQARTPTTTPKP